MKVREDTKIDRIRQEEREEEQGKTSKKGEYLARSNARRKTD